MTIAVSIGEAKARLSELVAASLRGEDVILQRAGVPQARIVALPEAQQLSIEERAVKRRAAFGMHAKECEGVDLSIEVFQNLYPEYERKFDDL